MSPHQCHDGGAAFVVLFWALCQVLGCDSLNHAPLLDLELFLYLIYFTMILGMANKPSSAHLKIN